MRKLKVRKLNNLQNPAAGKARVKNLIVKSPDSGFRIPHSVTYWL